MDARQQALEGKLEDLLRRASAVAVELQVLEQGEATPHYNQIETASQRVGQRLDRSIQEQRMRELAAEADGTAACPTCGKRRQVQTKRRAVASAAGPVELDELVAHCTRCRRDFFPSA